METRLIQTAEKCLRAAEDNTMTFPQIMGTLIQVGFESYCTDYRRAKAIYYRLDGDSVELTTDRLDVPVAEAFDTAAVQAAIREAQQLVPGYTYKDFCRKVVDAGCAGYIVSFSGRRAVYFGRTAETQVEHFPQ
jgi:uncharacterized protein YbcV (DUF1398 family)